MILLREDRIIEDARLSEDREKEDRRRKEDRDRTEKHLQAQIVLKERAASLRLHVKKKDTEAQESRSEEDRALPRRCSLGENSHEVRIANERSRPAAETRENSLSRSAQL